MEQQGYQTVWEAEQEAQELTAIYGSLLVAGQVEEGKDTQADWAALEERSSKSVIAEVEFVGGSGLVGEAKAEGQIEVQRTYSLYWRMISLGADYRVQDWSEDLDAGDQVDLVWCCRMSGL